MTEIVWSQQPGVFTRVAARTAKTTLLHLVASDNVAAFAFTISIDNAYLTQGFPPIQGPITYGVPTITIPDVPKGSVGYFDTNPVIVGSQEFVAKVTQALRKAESWGWSRALSIIRRIEAGTAAAWVALRARPHIPYPT